MKHSLLFVIALLTVQAPTAFAKCMAYHMQDADDKHPIPVPARPSEGAYYYMVKITSNRGSTTFAPVKSKKWNLSDNELKEAIQRFDPNPNQTYETLRGPINSKDHETLEALSYDYKNPDAFCERFEKFNSSIEAMRKDIGSPMQQSASVAQ